MGVSEIGVPPVIIHFSGIFPYKTIHFKKNRVPPHLWNPPYISSDDMFSINGLPGVSGPTDSAVHAMEFRGMEQVKRQIFRQKPLDEDG